MKKIYQTPNTAIVNINVNQHLLDASNPSAVINNTEIDDNDFASRRGSWIDDED